MLFRLQKILINRLILNLRQVAEDTAGNRVTKSISILRFATDNVLGNIGEPVSQPGNDEYLGVESQTSMDEIELHGSRHDEGRC